MYLLFLLDSEEKIYLSINIVRRTSMDDDIENILYPTKFLISLKFNCVSNHDLRLQIGVSKMLI